jgi:MFS family permease
VAGVLVGMAGGFLSDVVARRYGSRARVLLPASASLLATAAGVSMAGNQTLVLTGLGVWTLASAIGGISGFAALQELVAGESRGVAIAIVAFCNTLLGLGAGPSLVALVTERYFGDDLAVGRAIALIVAPAAAIACALFVTARIAEAAPRKAIDAPTQ